MEGNPYAKNEIPLENTIRIITKSYSSPKPFFDQLDAALSQGDLEEAREAGGALRAEFAILRSAANSLIQHIQGL